MVGHNKRHGAVAAARPRTATEGRGGRQKKGRGPQRPPLAGAAGGM